jgi:hypothetical protein
LEETKQMSVRFDERQIQDIGGKHMSN